MPNADMLSSINGDEVIALGAARQVRRRSPKFDVCNDDFSVQCYIENKYAKAQLATVGVRVRSREMKLSKRAPHPLAR